jgi:hypothetical protein
MTEQKPLTYDTGNFAQIMRVIFVLLLRREQEEITGDQEFLPTQEQVVKLRKRIQKAYNLQPRFGKNRKPGDAVAINWIGVGVLYQVKDGVEVPVILAQPDEVLLSWGRERRAKLGKT